MNEITLYDRITDPLVAVDRFGTFLARSGMLGCDKKEQGDLLALTMLCEKKSPVQILKEYHLIGGRLVDRADALASKFMSSGGHYIVNERSSEKASVTLTTVHQTMSFSLAWTDIQNEPWVKTRTGDLKEIYKSPRGRQKMLFWRCLSDAIAVMSPNVVTGLPEGEDEGSFQPAIEEPKELLRTVLPAPAQASPLPASSEQPSAAQSPPPPPAAPAKLEMPKMAVNDPATGSLNDETVAALKALCVGVEDNARQFAVAKGWVGQMEDPANWWRFIPTSKATAIFKQPENFLKAIEPVPKEMLPV